MTWTNPCFEF